MADEIQQAIQVIQLTGQSIGATVRLASFTTHGVIAAMKLAAQALTTAGKGAHSLYRHIVPNTKQSFRSLNEFASQNGTTLIEETIPDRDLKAIQKELSRSGVDFAVYQDHNGEHRLFIKAANEATLRVALEKVIASHAQEQPTPVETQTETAPPVREPEQPKAPEQKASEQSRPASEPPKDQPIKQVRLDRFEDRLASATAKAEAANARRTGERAAERTAETARQLHPDPVQQR